MVIDGLRNNTNGLLIRDTTTELTRMLDGLTPEESLTETTELELFIMLELDTPDKS